MRTSLAVERVDGRHRARIVSGLLRPQLLRADPDRCRVGLMATTALLLGGDTVELDISVGPGAVLDLFDVAGTVAYHGRGEAAGWHVRIEVAEAAALRYAGEPLVVADGADVTRTLLVDAASDARVLLRDTVVLGRSGEVGGRLRSSTELRVGRQPVLLEEQDLDPAGHRRSPGLLGHSRVLDTVTQLGPAAPLVSETTTYALVGGAGSLTRWLGTSLADSPLHRPWALLAPEGAARSG